MPQNCNSEQWGHQSHIPKWIYGKRHIGDKEKYFTVKNGAIPTRQHANYKFYASRNVYFKWMRQIL